MPNPSNRFHLWIYRAKPRLNSIMHTHAPYVSALSMIGVPLAVAHMDRTLSPRGLRMPAGVAGNAYR